MKKIAIPIADGQLSEFFGKCNHFDIIEIENDEIKNNVKVVPPHRDISKLPQWAAEIGITDIIAYKMDKTIINLFLSHKINIFIGIPKSDTKTLINDYMSGTLTSDKQMIHSIIN
jgi:predicted Fe-Mo cluster-binding NifX family protein